MTEKLLKNNFAFIATLIGWGFTLAVILWQVAVKDANYSLRLSTIENEITKLDIRLDTAEEFRITLASDLAEIKTDLLWIRKELQETASNVRTIKDDR
jgi:septal ring factor EnvC (AmiA/AmiB activator)|tara:strand:- start:344 stop:637 length:294 start_codon:yes stop_codon:yes gene_type:complete